MTRSSSPPPPSPAPLAPAWIYKTSPKGNKYRVCTIPLQELGRFLEEQALEPKIFFHYPPEGGEVLGVRKLGNNETLEL